VFQAQAKYADAERLLEHVLAIRDRALGANHPAVGETLNNLAYVSTAQGKYTKAEGLLKRALVIREKAHERLDNGVRVTVAGGNRGFRLGTPRCLTAAGADVTGCAPCSKISALKSARGSWPSFGGSLCASSGRRSTISSRLRVLQLPLSNSLVLGDQSAPRSSRASGNSVPLMCENVRRQPIARLD
jgi:tetratricopeptide (TPR) repeat protein